MVVDLLEHADLGTRSYATPNQMCDPDAFWSVMGADIKNEPNAMYWGPFPAPFGEVAECQDDDHEYRDRDGDGCWRYSMVSHGVAGSTAKSSDHCGRTGYEDACVRCCNSCKNTVKCHPDPRFYLPEDRWDTSVQLLGNHVLEVCPRWLVFVQGVGQCMSSHALRCPAPSAVGQDLSFPASWGENLQVAQWSSRCGVRI